MISTCRSGGSSEVIRDEVLRRLRRIVPIDAAFFATVDPATLLFTSAVADEPLQLVTGLFMDNEFGHADVNKFATLAVSQDPVSSLDRATSGERLASPRYRDVMAPLALGDEMRAALVIGGCCWGVMCLHREDGLTGFSDNEMRLVRGLVPHLAAGLRRAIVVEQATAEAKAGPGIVVVDKNLSIVSCNPLGEYWLNQLGIQPGEYAHGLPLVVHSLSARLAASQPAPETSAMASVRICTTGGRWLVVHASRLHGSIGNQTAIVFEPASGGALSSLILDAHGITPAQSRVVALVLQGRSTRQIVNDLSISSNTVQEHLHVVFDKFGVGSRRELVTFLLGGAH
jgi:DNA-binding CsgD family transcriptional regulator